MTNPATGPEMISGHQREELESSILCLSKKLALAGSHTKTFASLLRMNLGNWWLPLALLATWLFWAVALGGLGIALLRWMIALEAGLWALYLGVWVGASSVFLGLLAYHCFAPITSGLALVTISLGLICIVMHRAWWIETVAAVYQSVSWRWGLLLGVLSVWVANQSLGPAGWDDFNYELQAVRWARDYSLVPGLGNLHGRLAFNNAHHLFAALFAQGIWSLEPNHVFNGFFLLLTLLRFVWCCRAVAKGSNNFIDWFGAALLQPCLWFVFFGIPQSMLSTLKADLFVACALFTIASLFLEAAGPATYPPKRMALTITAVFACFATYTVKLNSLLFATVIILSLMAGRRRWGEMLNFRIKLVAGALCTLALLVPFRSVQLSGYPLYPVTTGGMNVDWLVKPGQAAAELAYIKAFSREILSYDPRVANDAAWFWHWCQVISVTDRYTIVQPVLALLFFLPQLSWKKLMQPSLSSSRYAKLAVLSASAISLLYWFRFAPAPRFGLAYVWIPLALVVAILAIQRESWSLRKIVLSSLFVVVPAYLAVSINPDLRMASRILIAIGVVATVSLPSVALRCIHHGRSAQAALVLMFFGAYPYGERLLKSLVQDRIQSAIAMLWKIPAGQPRAATELVAKRNAQGVVIYDAKESTVSTPLPSTPYYHPALELRDPRDLSKGFRNPGSFLDPRFGYTIRFLSVGSTKGPEGSEEVIPD